MYRLLIVDDDALARSFLRGFLPWEQRDFSIVGEAGNGEEALALVAKLSPDLVLTDLGMPGMDGLDLIHRLRAQGYAGGILVVSRHDEFDYVKEAMRLGADEYLRKNLLEQPLLEQALQRALRAREQRLVESAQRAELYRMLEKARRLTQRELLDTLLSRDLDWDAQYRETQRAGLPHRFYRCAALLAVADRADPTREPGLYEICLRAADEQHACVIELAADRCVLLYDFSDLPSASQQASLLQSQSHKLAQAVQAQLSAACRIGYSAVCEGGGTIAQAMRQASAALQLTFYGDAVCRCDPQQTMSSRVPQQAAAFRAQLPALLQRGERESIEQGFLAALGSFRAERTQVGAVLDWLRRCDIAAGIVRDEGFYASISALSDCRLCLRDYLDRALPGNGKVSPAVAHAMQYVRAHYTEPIGLGHAARTVGLSNAYLSRAFKRETGVGYSEFLRQCRLEQVRHELTHSLATVKEIAGRAGFQDYQHFCKMFKKKYGVSPSAYRKNPSPEA